MNVSHILKIKGTRVFTTGAGTPVAEAVALLSERNIGALVVTGDDGAVLGIFSERDVIHGLGGRGAVALDAPVSDHMTSRNLVTCTPDTTVDELMERMTERRIRHIPVLSEGRLAGVVSIGDVVKSRISEVEQEAAALREYIAT